MKNTYTLNYKSKDNHEWSFVCQASSEVSAIIQANNRLLQNKWEPFKYQLVSYSCILSKEQ